ncbi:MAG: right-handed parallel beta-helix repeat-containing protein [bacterium JZ-2024 1]
MKKKRSLLSFYVVFTTLLWGESIQQPFVYYVEQRKDGKMGSGSREDPFTDLQYALDSVPDGSVILLGEGTFSASPVEEWEQFCGNCEKPGSRVKFTRGFSIRGKSVTLMGKGKDRTILQTNAGYGLLVEDAEKVHLEHLKITGGKRDEDGSATDAAVVVRRSTVVLDNVLIEGNNDVKKELAVGVGGIFGREGAVITIQRSIIRDNSWDGIALYRGALATVRDTVIERGRGAGVGVTWDASALLIRVIVRDYWKGIGAFSNASVVAKNALVVNQVGWGVIAYGNARMELWNSVVAKNGNCGVAFWSENTSGLLINNIIWKNGGKEQWVCPRVGLWNNARRGNVLLRSNLFFGNYEKEIEGLEGILGKDGNVSFDPLFVDEETFRLQPESPARDAGDEGILDPDASRSDLGIYGGPFAWKTHQEG